MIYLFPDSTPVLYLSQSMHAFNFALLHTASIAYISGVYQNRQLAQQFYAGITFGLGAFVGSLLSGALYGGKLFLYAALITFAAFFLLMLEKKEVNKAGY
jgi:PPP family 3-phenylpropionic acid transporter